MKKSIALIALPLLLVLLLTGCKPNRPYARVMGYPEVVKEGNSITVKSAELGDGYLNVEVELDFTTLKLSDFRKIVVSTGSTEPDVECSVEKTKELNGEEKFNEIYSGKVILCFEDSRFVSTKKLEDCLYCLLVDYYRFALYN